MEKQRQSAVYEALTRLVFQSILSKTESLERESPVVWHGRAYTGKSGHKHEIDVSFEWDISGISILVLVECKYYQNSVDISDVLEFQSRIQDIGGHKGIIISTAGFRKGALRIAKAHRIALIQFNCKDFLIINGFGNTLPLFDQPFFTFVQENPVRSNTFTDLLTGIFEHDPNLAKMKPY